MTSTKVGLDLDKGVGTQGFDNVDGNSSDCDICLDFSLFVDWDGVYTIDTYWTYDSEKYFGGGGYYPADAHAEYFDPQQWDYESYSLSETTYTSDKGIVNVEDDSVNDGLPFVADDGAASDGTGYWAGLNIVPINDWSERYVYGEYVHTWNETSTNYSVGASYPAGVSISFSQSTEVKKEKTGTEGDGDTLMKLRQSDAV